MLGKSFNFLMSMALVGFVRLCGENTGGGKRLWLIEAADAGTFTLGTGTEYATTTPEVGKFYKEYEFKEDLFEFKEEIVFENGVSSVVKTIEFYVDKMDTLSRDMVEEIKVASLCGMNAIAEDNNGIKWVVGYGEKFLMRRPLRLKTGTSTTGKALTDANGRTVFLGMTDSEHSREFTGTVPIV